MMHSLLIKVFYWIWFPTIVRGLDCFQCETQDLIKGCTSNISNLHECPEKHSCYKMSWSPNEEAYRGCIDLTNETVTLDCSAEWELCELDVKEYVTWKCWGLKSELVDNFGHLLTWTSDCMGKRKTSGWNERVQKVFNATDVGFCYCDEHGCNNSLKCDGRPGIYIVLLFSVLSKVVEFTGIIL